MAGRKTVRRICLVITPELDRKIVDLRKKPEYERKSLFGKKSASYGKNTSIVGDVPECEIHIFDEKPIYRIRIDKKFLYKHHTTFEIRRFLEPGNSR